MEITYFGHSAFRVRGKEVAIVTDPDPTTTGPLEKLHADVVTISHHDPQRDFAVDGEGGPRIVDGPGEYEVADILIAGVATAAQPEVGPLNTAYVFRLDDVVVCHLGDLKTKLTDTQVEELGSIDVLFIPVGGGEALGSAQAAEVVAQLDPSLVVPMHYRLNGSSAPAGSLEPVDVFCREMGSKEFVAESKLTVTKSSLPPEVRVVVLESKRV